MNDKTKIRRIGITIAVILGLFAIWYLGGLVGQLMRGQDNWLTYGMYGPALPSIEFGILYNLRNALTEQGRSGLLFVGVAVGGTIGYRLLTRRKFRNNDLDDRNFARSKSGTYGTAGWMTDKEMKKVLEVTTPAKAKGIILGEKNGKVICLPKDTRLNKHILALGASGTMKSRAIVRNLMFQCMKSSGTGHGESVIVTDPKGGATRSQLKRLGVEPKICGLKGAA